MFVLSKIAQNMKIFERIGKSNAWMGAFALLTVLVVVAYVVDQYRNKDFYGLAKPKATGAPAE
jgi:hypothetical protein